MLIRPLSGGRIKQNLFGEIDMKTQMRFQKILMLVTIIVAALSFVYALSFCSGTIYQYGTLRYTSGNRVLERVPGAIALYDATQLYNGILITLSIIFIVVAALNFIMASQKRRNYYVTNYVATGITVAFQLVFAIILIYFLADTLSLFNAIDKVAAEAAYRGSDLNKFKYSTVNFILGFVLTAVIVLNAVAVILNLVWKIKLMQGEKKLLAAKPVSQEEVKTEEAV